MTDKASISRAGIIFTDEQLDIITEIVSALAGVARAREAGQFDWAPVEEQMVEVLKREWTDLVDVTSLADDQPQYLRGERYEPRRTVLIYDVSWGWSVTTVGPGKRVWISRYHETAQAALQEAFDVSAPESTT